MVGLFPFKTTTANDGTLREQFFADTGANRHIYPTQKLRPVSIGNLFPLELLKETSP